MGPIRQWFLSLCGAMAITGIFNVFLSNTNFKKAINVFLSIFVLFYTVIPLTDIKTGDIDLDFESVEINELTKDSYEQIILMTIKNVCDEREVEVISVDIDSHINDDNNLAVDKILVEIDSTNKSEEIESILKNEFGFEVSVK